MALGFRVMALGFRVGPRGFRVGWVVALGPLRVCMNRYLYRDHQGSLKASRSAT